MNPTPNEISNISPQYAPTRQSAKPERVAFYIPSLTPDGKKVYGEFDQSRLVEITRNFLAFEFGGATLVPAQGWYVDEAKLSVQEEGVVIAYAYAERAQVEDHRETIEGLANDICYSFNQQSVAFEMGGVLYLASPAKKYATWQRDLARKFKAGKPDVVPPPWLRYLDMKALILKRQKSRETKLQAERDAMAAEEKARREKRRLR